MAAFLSTYYVIWGSLHVALFEANGIYVCYYYAMFSSFLSLLNFVTMFIVYATFCSVNVLIFIGSTAGPLSYLVKRLGSKGRKRKTSASAPIFFLFLLQVLQLFRQLKNTEAFTVNLCFFYLNKSKKMRKKRMFSFANFHIFLEI